MESGGRCPYIIEHTDFALPFLAIECVPLAEWRRHRFCHGRRHSAEGTPSSDGFDRIAFDQRRRQFTFEGLQFIERWFDGGEIECCGHSDHPFAICVPLPSLLLGVAREIAVT